MNRYRLVHTTEFLYDGPVSESYNEVRLRPLHDERQSCLSFRLITAPSSRGTSYRDAFGNWVNHFNVLPEHRSLRVEAESVVLAHETSEVPPDPSTLAEMDARNGQLDEEHFDFVAPTSYVPHLTPLRSLIEEAERLSDGTVEGFARAASDLIHQRFRYVKGATHVHSSIEDSLSMGAGVCQDFAHLLLGIVRMRGIPGRYVSGYLVPGSACFCRRETRRSHRRAGVARVGGSAHAKERLDGARSDAGQTRGNAACSRGLRARLRRCRAGPRRVQGPRRAEPGRGRPRPAGAG